MSGRSQAVRIPAQFRFPPSEVYIRHDPKNGDVIWCPPHAELRSVPKKELADALLRLTFAHFEDTFAAPRW